MAVFTPNPRKTFFLVRWLAGAEKQRRFSREVARDISWLLNQGRLSGMNARLHSKLEFIWRAGSGDILAQTDMFRLSWGLETLKGYKWGYYVLSDSEWSGRRRTSMRSASFSLHWNGHLRTTAVSCIRSG